MRLVRATVCQAAEIGRKASVIAKPHADKRIQSLGETRKVWWAGNGERSPAIA